MTSKPIMMPELHPSAKAAEKVLELRKQLNRGNVTAIAGQVVGTVDVVPSNFPGRMSEFGRAHQKAAQLSGEVFAFSDFLHDVKKSINDNHVSVDQIAGQLGKAEMFDSMKRAILLPGANMVPLFAQALKVEAEKRQPKEGQAFYSGKLEMGDDLLLIANQLLSQQKASDQDEFVRPIFMKLEEARKSLHAKSGILDSAISEMKGIMAQIAEDLRKTASIDNVIGA